jgi:hypothetical protein
MPTLLDNDSFIHKNERQEHQKDSLWKSSFNSDWRGSYCDEWLRVDDENMNILLPLNVDNVRNDWEDDKAVWTAPDCFTQMRPPHRTNC